MSTYLPETVQEALRQLTEDWGMGWSEIARVAGVPVSRVRSWRAGPDTAPQQARDNLGQMLVHCRLLRENGALEPVALLGCPLVEGYTITGWDLYFAGRAGHISALYAIAAGRPAEEVLDELMHDWRRAYWSDYEVFVAEDGHLSVRHKQSEGT